MNNLNYVTLTQDEVENEFDVISSVEIKTSGEIDYSDGKPKANVKNIHESIVPEGEVNIYRISNHEIDIEKAVKIGLGVLENKQTKERVLFNSLRAVETGPTKIVQDTEIMRLTIYYQLAFPDYDDPAFNQFLDETANYEGINNVILSKDNAIIKELDFVMNRKKGLGDNVISFKVYKK
ncbi:hypothetical protein [Gracilibacillus thailandensis]|uniref:Uncharacterized protein n=1 Tax=Gracilibacillus thailandensis TaxID=563735 RepID=A0A6N7QYQ5_9BACI|nr:hypothetical protein [Gracilibacillus thailandensis]MRI66634.1 hypothetical protein [Gracilibacillus thailandensis]